MVAVVVAVLLPIKEHKVLVVQAVVVLVALLLAAQGLLAQPI
jgi:hypothetical protein